MHHLLRFVCALFLTAALTGCDTFREAFREAMSGESTRSEDPNSENYQPRYIVGIFSIVKYPRATELEKEIQALDGRTVWINTNQNFSSKNIREARMISRPGNPDLCDLQFRIDRLGKLQWQVLCGRYGAEKIIFSGIAGNMSAAIGIGDVCVGKLVVYHDADTRCIVQSAPFLEEFPGDPALVQCALAACAACGVKAIAGKIATGDRFVGDSATKAAIAAACAPDCVEMEGAAVAQIAARNGVPCVILRAMSDNADEEGYERLVVKDFSIDEYVATATRIVETMIESL